MNEVRGHLQQLLPRNASALCGEFYTNVVDIVAEIKGYAYRVISYALLRVRCVPACVVSVSCVVCGAWSERYVVFAFE